MCARKKYTLLQPKQLAAGRGVTILAARARGTRNARQWSMNPLWTDQNRPKVTLHHLGLPAHQLELVEASFARISGRLDSLAAGVFHKCVSNPAIHHLFVGDAEQRELAVSFFGFVVSNLRSVTRLCELLERMGARGLLTGVTSTNLGDIGKALLVSLHELEGRNWTHETEHAWALAYVWTTSAIRRGSPTHIHEGHEGEISPARSTTPRPFR